MSRLSIVRILTFSTAALALVFVALRLQTLVMVLATWDGGSNAALYRALYNAFTDAAHAAFAAYVAFKVDRLGPVLGAMYFAGGAFARSMPGGDDVVLNLLGGLALGACGAAAIRFSQLFPRAIQPDELPLRSPRRRLLPQHAALRLLLVPLVPWVLVVSADVTHRVLQPSWAGTGNMLRNVLVAGTALLFVRHNYHRSSASEQRKIYWIMQGILLILLASVAALLLRPLGLRALASVTFMTGQLALVTCVAFAVFYTGALDSRLMVQRTAVVSATTAILVLLFVTIETVATNLLVNSLGMQGGAAPVIAGVIAALAFRGVHSAAEPFVRRFLPVIDGARS